MSELSAYYAMVAEAEVATLNTDQLEALYHDVDDIDMDDRTPDQQAVIIAARDELDRRRSVDGIRDVVAPYRQFP